MKLKSSPDRLVVHTMSNGSKLYKIEDNCRRPKIPSAAIQRNWKVTEMINPDGSMTIRRVVLNTDGSKTVEEEEYTANDNLPPVKVSSQVLPVRHIDSDSNRPVVASPPRHNKKENRELVEETYTSMSSVSSLFTSDEKSSLFDSIWDEKDENFSTSGKTLSSESSESSNFILEMAQGAEDYSPAVDLQVGFPKPGPNSSAIEGLAETPLSSESSGSSNFIPEMAQGAEENSTTVDLQVGFPKLGPNSSAIEGISKKEKNSVARTARGASERARKGRVRFMETEKGASVVDDVHPDGTVAPQLVLNPRDSVDCSKPLLFSGAPNNGAAAAFQNYSSENSDSNGASVTERQRPQHAPLSAQYTSPKRPNESHQIRRKERQKGVTNDFHSTQQGVAVTVLKKSQSDKLGIHVGVRVSRQGRRLIVADISPVGLFVNTPIQMGDIILSINGVSFQEDPDANNALGTYWWRKDQTHH
jgi:hypothetical protein